MNRFGSERVGHNDARHRAPHGAPPTTPRKQSPKPHHRPPRPPRPRRRTPHRPTTTQKHTRPRRDHAGTDPEAANPRRREARPRRAPTRPHGTQPARKGPPPTRRARGLRQGDVAAPPSSKAEAPQTRPRPQAQLLHSSTGRPRAHPRRPTGDRERQTTRARRRPKRPHPHQPKCERCTRIPNNQRSPMRRRPIPWQLAPSEIQLRKSTVVHSVVCFIVLKCMLLLQIR